VLQGVYAEILKRIEAQNYDVMTQRVSLTSREKMTAIGKLWVQAMMVKPA
jgi:phytoene/squalene synthetase